MSTKHPLLNHTPTNSIVGSPERVEVYRKRAAKVEHLWDIDPTTARKGSTILEETPTMFCPYDCRLKDDQREDDSND